MASVGDLLVNLGINVSGFTSGLSTAENAMVQAGTRMYFLGARIAAGFGAPLAMAAGAVANFGMEFDAAMTESLAIMQDVTPQMRKEMEKTAKAIAESSTFSSEQAATAYYSLASAGYDAVESMKLLPVVSRFAQAGVMDLAKATQYLSTAQMAMGTYVKGDYQKNMEEMTRISDVLTEANNRSVGTVQQFAEALTNKAGQSLRFFNKSVEEGVAALAMLHQQGTIGKAAGQQLFMVIRDLGVYSLKFADVWKKQGIAVYDAAGKMRNLADIMGDLEKRTEGMSDKGKRMLLMMLGIPQRSISATIALMNTADAMKEMQAALENAGGATERVAGKQLESFKNQIILLKNQGVNILIGLFDQFSGTINDTVIPALKSLLASGKALADWLGSLSEGWKSAILYMGTFLVALGPIILVIGSTVLAFRGILGILTLFTGVVGGAFIRIGLLVGLFPALRTGALTGAAALAALGKGFTTASGAAALTGVTFASFAASALIVITTLGLIGYGIYKLVKASDSLQTSLDRDSKAFSKHTDVLSDAVAKYDEYWAKQSKIGIGPQQREDIQEYDRAIRTMADALGISEVQMRKELETSDEMLVSLREQIRLRQELAMTARLARVEEAGAIEAEINALSEQYRKLQGGVVNVPARTAYDASGLPVEIPEMTIKLDPMVRIRQQGNISSQIEQLRKRYDLIMKESERGSDYGLPSGKKYYPSINLSDYVDRDPTLPRLEGLPAPTGTDEPDPAKEKVDAYHRSVADLAGFLAGDGKRSFNVLKDAWASLSLEQQTNTDTLERLWEEYKKIRPTLSPEEIPADIDFMTSSLREQEEFMAQYESPVRKLISGMEGLDPAVEAMRSQFSALAVAYNTMEGHMDPKWIMANKDAWEGLLLEYDSLPPEIQAIVAEYVRLRDQANQAAEATKNAGNKIAESFAAIEMDMAAKVMDKQTELLGYSLNTADKELIGLKNGLAELRNQHTQAFVKMAKDLKGYTGKNKEMAAASMANTRKMMTELEKLTEKTELLRIASALGADKFSLSWMSKQDLDRMKDYVVYLGKLYDRLLQVGRVSGSLRAVGEAFKAWNLVGVGEWLTKTADLMERTGKAGATLGEGLKSNQIDKIIQGLAGIAAAFGEISQMASQSERAMSGALAGASAGFALGGGWGAVAGAVWGAITGAMMPDPGWARIRDMIADKYSMVIEQGVASAIAIVKAKHPWMSDDMAAIFSLDTLIDSAGGVNNATIDTWSDRLAEMFAIWSDYQAQMAALMAKQRALNAAVPGTDPNFGLEEQMQALAEAAVDLQNTFDRVFPKIAEAVVNSGKIASAEFLGLIQLMRETGLESKALMEFASTQLARFTGAWDKVAAPLMAFVTGLDAAKTELKEFNEEMEKSGKYDPKTGKYSDLGVEEQKELADILKKIEDLYKKDTHAAAEAGEEAERLGRLLMAAFNGAIETGMDLFAALDAIGPQLDQLILAYKTLGIESDNAALNQLMHMRQLINDNPELLAGVQGLNEMTLALSNLGGLTAETLADLEAQGMHMYERMINAGFTEQQTLAAMVPWLRTIYDAHKQLGIPIDENTQKLIDQATKLGLLDEDDPTQILKQGFKDLLQAVKDLTQALLDMPASVKTRVDVDTYYHNYYPDPLPSNPDLPPDPGIPQAHGGYYRVSSPTTFLAGEAGPEEVLFSGANRTISTQSPGNSMQVTFNIQAMDPIGIRRVVEEEIAPTLVSVWRRNVNGLRTNTRRELVE